jgi:hypothetical protein
MTGPELEEAVAWVEVSLKGRMVKRKKGVQMLTQGRAF